MNFEYLLHVFIIIFLAVIQIDFKCSSVKTILSSQVVQEQVVGWWAIVCRSMLLKLPMMNGQFYLQTITAQYFCKTHNHVLGRCHKVKFL